MIRIPLISNEFRARIYQHKVSESPTVRRYHEELFFFLSHGDDIGNSCSMQAPPETHRHPKHDFVCMRDANQFRKFAARNAAHSDRILSNKLNRSRSDCRQRPVPCTGTVCLIYGIRRTLRKAVFAAFACPFGLFFKIISLN